MPTKAILIITHEICPENEYLSGQELIDGTLDGLLDDPVSFLGSPAVSFVGRVEREGGDTYETNHATTHYFVVDGDTVGE